jgi:hypothetical protein
LIVGPGTVVGVTGVVVGGAVTVVGAAAIEPVVVGTDDVPTFRAWEPVDVPPQAAAVRDSPATKLIAMILFVTMAAAPCGGGISSSSLISAGSGLN